MGCGPTMRQRDTGKKNHTGVIRKNEQLTTKSREATTNGLRRNAEKPENARTGDIHTERGEREKAQTLGDRITDDTIV